MKKNLKEYVIVFAIIVLVGLLLIIIKNNILSLFNEVIDTEWQTGNYEEKDPIIDDSKNYSINYSDGKYIYNMSSSDDMDYIHIKKMVMNKCISSIDESCSQNVVEEYELTLEGNNLNIARDIIIKLYNKHKEDYIFKNDLENDDFNIINALINNNLDLLSSNVKYEIIMSNEEGIIISDEESKKEKGYIIKKNSDYSYVGISAGQKPCTGFSIRLKNIEKKDNDIYIIVEETEPGKDEMCLTVLTYPNLKIKIYDEFDNIIVKNTQNNVYNEKKVNE